jgi:tripartite-type tricarboxylate transporter receptor subunit TctC
MRVFRNILLATMTVAAASMAQAQDYPNRPITMYAPEAGGGADALARQVAEGMSTALKQPVVVVNNPGNVALPVGNVLKAPADGYTILFYSNSVWVQPFLDKTPYDPVKDLVPIGMALRSPAILAVHPSLGVKTVAELVALAKSKPGVIDFAAGGIGSANHLAGELFKSAAGVDMTYIPFRGAGPALNAVVAGEVKVLFATATTVMPFAEAGTLIPLGVTTAEPTDLAPKIPTVASTVKGYEASVNFAVMAKAGTPKPIVDALSKALIQAVKSGGAKERFAKAGAEAVGTTPEQLAAYIKDDMTKMEKVIKDAHIKIN